MANKAFELTPDELAALKAKVAAEKPEGGMKEAEQRAAVAKALEFLKDKKQEEANAYIAKNCMITEITKPFMAAYIKTYATEEDADWIKGDFKKASTKVQTRKVTTVCMGANNIPIHKINKKGQAVTKTVRVDAITGETYETFNLAGARAEFVAHFGITPKANKFTPKSKRTTVKYDPFADLF
jgi:hypothetical protein